MDHPIDFYQSLPKVDLHRHLEGSLRLRTIREITRAQRSKTPASSKPLSDRVRVQTSDPNTYQNFLAKFDTLRLFYRSPEVIQRVTREAVEDAAKDAIHYLELRFSPVALSHAERFPLGEVMDWVCVSASQAARDFNLRVRLIASVNRHESPELAEQVAWLSAERIPHGLLGLDLAGNEAEFPMVPFQGIFKEARLSGLKLTVHAGEWAGAENVRQAIEILNADRIGHGVRVMEDSETVALARERGTAFEVCVTSNYHTGAVGSLQDHPLMKMVRAGLNVVLGTDDPSISQITLSNEYRRSCEDLELPQDQLKERILLAAQVSFLQETERKKLVEELRQELHL